MSVENVCPLNFHCRFVLKQFFFTLNFADIKKKIKTADRKAMKPIDNITIFQVSKHYFFPRIWQTNHFGIFVLKIAHFNCRENKALIKMV
jgi:hypothetical protein